MAQKTSNEELFDALVRHQIFLLRYSGYVRNRMTALLNKSEEELAMRIRDKLRSLGGLTTPREWERLQSLYAGLDTLRRDSWAEAREYLLDEMTQLSYHEPIVVNGIVQTVLPVVVQTVMPSPNLLRSIALARPFEGRVLKDWARSMEDDDIRRIHSAIQAGMVAGEDSATIARRVVGSSTLRGADGVTEVTRRQVEAVVRTAVNHVGTHSRDAWYSENTDVMTAEQFVATLDSRTTPVCRANDGKQYEVGKGPKPPLHFACRSLRIPVIGATLVGNRPAKPTTEKLLVQEFAKQHGYGDITSRAALPRGTKGAYDDWSRRRIRELVGQVPATETYQTWLSKQSTAFQNEVLGQTKGKLFRDGGLQLDKFVNRNGDELTLKELAAKHADAFRAAGLDPAAY